MRGRARLAARLCIAGGSSAAAIDVGLRPDLSAMATFGAMRTLAHLEESKGFYFAVAKRFRRLAAVSGFHPTGRIDRHSPGERLNQRRKARWKVLTSRKPKPSLTDAIGNPWRICL